MQKIYILPNNTINWNNKISNLWIQSSKKVLHLTERHVEPLDLLSNTLKMWKVEMHSMLNCTSYLFLS